MTPQRIQRKRTRGWTMPEGAIYVGRPTGWGNPFRVGDRATPTAYAAVAEYEDWLVITPEGQQIIAAAKRLLRGNDLVCWCQLDQPCHADVLLRIANEGDAPKPLDADAAP